MIALTASRLYTPLESIEQPVVLLDGSRIVEVSSRSHTPAPEGVQHIDFPDSILAPGFVDIHIHGGAGHDVMETDPAALPAVEQLLAKHGVTSYLPTTVTASGDHILSALDRLATAIENAERDPGLPRTAGAARGYSSGRPVHQFRSPGSASPARLAASDACRVFERFWQAARGRIRMMTIAPELEGAREVIAEAARRGVCVSLGHSDANLHDTRAGGRGGSTPCYACLQCHAAAWPPRTGNRRRRAHRSAALGGHHCRWNSS